MRVFVAGHRGMVGGAISKKLVECGVEVVTRARSELDLTNQCETRDFFAAEAIDAVVLAAAKVGGIHANNIYPAEFIYENLMIECNIIHEAFSSGIQKLLFLGSSCIYPREVAQPMREDALLTGILEPTNEPYAIAKIAGIKLCESYNRQYGTDYRSVMPTNLYGPGDNFHPQNSHVLPGLIRRFHEAVRDGTDQVAIWGTGKPRREFLHVDDMADASIFIMNLPREQYEASTKPMLSHINVGSGQDVSIFELAQLVAQATGFTGEIVLDASKPDGAMRKLMDSTRLNALGWMPQVSLAEGIRNAYAWFLANRDSPARSRID